jgi:hypothetical protein
MTSAADAATTQAHPPSTLGYAAFGLFNVTTGGIAGMALPLFAGDARLASVAGALLNLGIAVGAPLVAGLSRHLSGPAVLGGSTLAAAAAFLALSVHQAALFLGAAFLVGYFTAAGLTLGTLFVMGWYAKPQWDAQVGWLQTWMGAGQVLGLVLAGLVTARLPLAVLGALVLAGAGLWALRLPAPSPGGTTAIPQAGLQHTARTEIAGALHGHHLAAFRPAQWPVLRDRTLLTFLVPWALANMGSMPIFAVYPLLMHQRFGLSIAETAWTYALAALLGTGLYELAGRWVARIGASVVLLAGYLVRSVALAGIAAAIALHAAGAVALLSFMIVVGTWSLLSVAGNLRCVEVAPPGAAGAEVGAFYAVTMLAKVCGGLVGGALVLRTGYAPLLALSALLPGLAAAWTALGVLQVHRSQEVATSA